MECRYGEPPVGGGVPGVPFRRGRCGHRPARVIPSQCSHWRGNPFPLCGVVRAPRPTSCAVTLRRGRRPDVPSARQRRAVIARRAAPRQSVPLPQISAKITTIPRRILCTYPKYGNFAGNGCAGGGGVLYSDRQSHTRGAPMGAGFFSYIYIFRKRITGRLRNKF